MYDAADRRFLATDIIKGTVTNPLTMVPYTYVLDNPLKWVDPSGAYYIKSERDNNGNIYYYAEAQTTSKTIARAFQQTVLGEPGRGKGVWGGNSVSNDLTVDSLAESLIGDQAEKGLEKIAEFVDSKLLSDVASVFGKAGKAWEAVTFVRKASSSYGNIQQFDSVIFKLFDIANFKPNAPKALDVQKYMQRAYSFVKSNPNYFLTGARSGEDSYFWMHVKIKEAKDPEKIIKSYYSAFYNTLSDAITLEINGTTYINSGQYVKSLRQDIAETFAENLRMYKDTLQGFADALVDYMMYDPPQYIGPRTVW